MWQATDSAVWQGRDDSRESPEALRVFQTVQQHSAWPTTLGKGDIALIGFASDTAFSAIKGASVRRKPRPCCAVRWPIWRIIRLLLPCTMPVILSMPIHN